MPHVGARLISKFIDIETVLKIKFKKNGEQKERDVEMQRWREIRKDDSKKEKQAHDCAVL